MADSSSLEGLKRATRSPSLRTWAAMDSSPSSSRSMSERASALASLSSFWLPRRLKRSRKEASSPGLSAKACSSSTMNLRYSGSDTAPICDSKRAKSEAAIRYSDQTLAYSARTSCPWCAKASRSKTTPSLRAQRPSSRWL